jgi:hypothetical protein
VLQRRDELDDELRGVADEVVILLGRDGEYWGMTPAELADHYASNTELVTKINHQLDPLLREGDHAVGTLRDVVDRLN